MNDQHSTPSPGDLPIPGFDAPGTSPGTGLQHSRNYRSSSRKAVWIGLAALTAVGAVATPVIVHYSRPKPAHLQTPAQLAGLTRDQSDNATATADYLRNAIAAGMGLDSPVAAVYSDGSGDAHSVIFVGGTSSDGSAGTRLTRMFGLLDDATDSVSSVTPEMAGTLGGTMRCGLATNTDPAQPTSTDVEMAVCGWADRDSVGIALFPNRTIPDAAVLLRTMRAGIQKKE